MAGMDGTLLGHARTISGVGADVLSTEVETYDPWLDDRNRLRGLDRTMRKLAKSMHRQAGGSVHWAALRLAAAADLDQVSGALGVPRSKALEALTDLVIRSAWPSLAIYVPGACQVAESVVRAIRAGDSATGIGPTADFIERVWDVSSGDGFAILAMGTLAIGTVIVEASAMDAGLRRSGIGTWSIPPAGMYRDPPNEDPRVSHADTPWTAPSESNRGATRPAAWIADPTGRYQYRWWDGSSWTAHVAAEGRQTSDVEGLRVFAQTGNAGRERHSRDEYERWRRHCLDWAQMRGMHERHVSDLIPEFASADQTVEPVDVVLARVNAEWPGRALWVASHGVSPEDSRRFWGMPAWVRTYCSKFMLRNLELEYNALLERERDTDLAARLALAAVPLFDVGFDEDHHEESALPIELLWRVLEFFDGMDDLAWESGIIASGRRTASGWARLLAQEGRL